MKNTVNIFVVVLIVFWCLSLNSVMAENSDFYAYYTKVSHSATDYVGKYADIVVVLGRGKQLEFTRQTGYLPRWRTRDKTYLIDDLFPGRDRDYEFNYTYVRLIEDSPEKIVVHWRYFTDIEALKVANSELDPLTIHGFTGVVHELFSIFPDGKIIREIKEASGTRSHDWDHPDLKTVQTIQLTDSGINHDHVKWGRPGPYYPRAAVAGNRVKEIEGLPEPVRRWTFDEGSEPHEDMVIDDVTEAECLIHGLMTVFKKGVSGTALAFDGYYTDVTIEWEEEKAKEPTDAMTIEAWMALDVYPYNTAPIIHHSTGFGEKGYYFGLDAYGHLLFTMNGTHVKSQTTLPLYQWKHLAASVGSGGISLYVDGEEVATSPYKGGIDTPGTKLHIGRNSEKERCTDYVRGPDQNLLFIYGIQGLLDEIKIYDQKLSQAQLQTSYETFLPAERTSDLAKGVLPGEVGAADEFGASYRKLKFHELWDNLFRTSDHPDIVVKFEDSPCSVVYWRGANSAASWVTDNNRWMADQSSEIFTKHGCSEHMADKQSRHSYARIIENSPARVVIHWRYPCVDVSYYCANRRNWSDEYHTIYPDGTGVRKVVWNKTYGKPGFQDIQFFTNPGETALDVVNLQGMSIANLDGDVRHLTWSPPNNIPRNTLPDASIELLNSKSRHKVFAIFQGGRINPWGRNEQSKYTDDPFAGPWNHWPIHLVPSDGRFAVSSDRVTHFALGANDATPRFGSRVLYGFTDQSIETLVPLARSWRIPTTIVKTRGLRDAEYETDQKAFVMTSTSSRMSFTVNASDQSPVVNPCFVIKNWGGDKEVSLKIDGSELSSGTDFRQGTVRDTDGTQTKIIWIKTTASSPAEFLITK